MNSVSSGSKGPVKNLYSPVCLPGCFPQLCAPVGLSLFEIVLISCFVKIDVVQLCF